MVIFKHKLSHTHLCQSWVELFCVNLISYVLHTRSYIIWKNLKEEKHEGEKEEQEGFARKGRNEVKKEER